MPKITGYTFNSAICCPDCTRLAFETGELTRDFLNPERLDQHRLPDDMTNTNYEPVRPVFSTDDYPDGWTCDECGEPYP